MEPAVKPAARATLSGTIAVLATPATLQGELFATTAERHAQGIRLIGEPCPGLVNLIESGGANSPETEALLRTILAHALGAGADHIVLACTHYPFVLDTIRRIVGPSVQVIDPAPAVARQLGRVLAERGLLAGAREPLVSSEVATHRFITTGDPQRFAQALRDLVGVHAPAQAAHWRDDVEFVLEAGRGAP